MGKIALKDKEVSAKNPETFKRDLLYNDFEMIFKWFRMII